MTMITNDPSSGTDLYKIAVHENVWVLNMELPDLLISGKLHEIIGYIHDAGFNILTTPDSEGKISFVLSTENKTQHDCRGLTQRLKNRYLKSN